MLPQNINSEVDLVLFAGQSNMSGRGNAKEAVICDENAGFEYKAISKPDCLLSIREPFGLGEDKEGAIWDYDFNGVSKRTGSMVSAVVDEYYKQSGRQIVAVSASIGGTNTVEWNNNYVHDAVQRLDAATAFLGKNKINIGHCFVVWCQGESDGDVGRSREDYKNNICKIFNLMKSHGAEKIFMIQTGHYNYIDYPGENDALTGKDIDKMYAVIRTAQEELCNENEDYILAGSLEPYINYMKDNYHYNQKAYNEAGRNVGKEIAEYYKNIS